MNTITIKDDFDLEKIRTSGQCFRVKRIDIQDADCPVYSFIYKDSNLEIQESNNIKNDKKAKHFNISCSIKEWENVWHNYFDIETDYENIRKEFKDDNNFTDTCMDFGKGLRILNQDPWEMLITFIISQRRSMPAIASSVEKLCNTLGSRIECKGAISDNTVEFFKFPTPEQIYNADIKQISDCGVGYRDEYIKCAAEMVISGDLNLDAIDKCSDEELFNQLCRVKGVGTKVANCIMLFGYHRCGRAPVDVWIDRVIKQDFNGENPFPKYGDVAGIIQQYFFYYKTRTRK